jgi:WD40 repeat protein
MRMTNAKSRQLFEPSILPTPFMTIAHLQTFIDRVTTIINSQGGYDPLRTERMDEQQNQLRRYIHLINANAKEPQALIESLNTFKDAKQIDLPIEATEEIAEFIKEIEKAHALAKTQSLISQKASLKQDAKKNAGSFAFLPHEIFLIILQYLDETDVQKISKTCSYLYQQCQDPNLVDFFAKRAFPDAANYKQLYAITTKMKKGIFEKTTLPFSPCSIIEAPTGELITGSVEGTIKIWKEDQLICTLNGHSTSVTHLVFSPNGEKLISGSTDKTIKIWDLVNKKDIGTLSGHLGPIEKLFFFSTDRLISCSCYDQTIKIWDLQQRICIHTFEVQRFCEAILSSNKQELIVSFSSGLIKIWNLTTLKLVTSWEAHLSGFSLIPSHHGEIVTSGAGTLKIWKWNSITHTLLHTFNIKAHNLLFSSKGELFINTGRTIQIWDLETAIYLDSLEVPKKVVISQIFFTSTKHLASFSSDNQLRIWDLITRQCMCILNLSDGHRTIDHPLFFTSTGKLILIGNQTIIWNFGKSDKQ